MKMISPEQMIQMCRLAPSRFDKDFMDARIEMGRFATSVFYNSFQYHKIEGTDMPTWAKRRKEYPWDLMVKTGALRGSISFQLVPGGVRISTDIPYSQFHNDGADKYGTPYRRNQYTNLPITRRQFIGNTPVIDRFIQRRLKQLTKAVFVL